MGAGLTASLFSVLLSFVLALVIAVTYRKSHDGLDYSPSFAHTIVIMATVVAVVMIVIGNNIAVAFGLVGAFSIIRLRSVVCGPKDLAFIFFAMTTGIAAGLGYHSLAIVFCLLVNAIILGMARLNFGEGGALPKTLQINVPESDFQETGLNDILTDMVTSWRLRSMSSAKNMTRIDLEYDIVCRDGVSDRDLLDAVRSLGGEVRAAIKYSRTD